MITNRVEVVVVGGGQAGLAMSYCLTAQGRAHVVLEQHRIAEAWRSQRWDSLRLVSPNWTLRLPGWTYTGPDPHGFMRKDELVEHLVAYATSFGAPVHEGVRVTGIEVDVGHGSFLVHTEGRSISASQVVLATGALQRPWVPACAADLPLEITQIVAPAYRNPRQLPPGAVLVVGSGESGCQIAQELNRAGRRVYLCVGKSWWAPRRYCGRDIAFWLRALRWFARTVDDLPPGVRTGLPNPQLCGGAHDLSGHTLAREGVTLLGRLQAIADGTLILGGDLASTLAWGDEQTRHCLTTIDALLAEQGIGAPQEWPRDLHGPPVIPEPPRVMNMMEAGIRSVVWATGYRPELSWVGLPFLDPAGYPMQRRGVTIIPGLFILGLDWLHTAGSGIFPGLADDAGYLATTMAAH